MENYDMTIIGSGILGSILAYQANRLNPDMKILNVNKNSDNNQTFKSQFYIHRGHFYLDKRLTSKLNNTFVNWVSLIRDLGLTTYENRSFIGFYENSDAWIQNWMDADIPFKEVNVKNLMGYEMNLNKVYAFPHVLIDGNELMNKLVNETQVQSIQNEIKAIHPTGDGYEISFNSGKVIKSKKISICAGGGTDEVISKIKDADFNIGIQHRFCQVLVLSGNLPNLSLLVPDQQTFIAPQYDQLEGLKWLCTYGEDPIIKERDGTDTLDFERVKQQLEHLKNIFPTLSNYVTNSKMYTARKVESSMLGNGHRPNDVFVENLNEDIAVCLPTKLSLAFEASNTIMNKLSIN